MIMQPVAATDMDGPVELDELDRTVLWAMRSVAVGRLECPSLRRAFLDLYGPAADQILCALLVMVRLLACRTGRGLRMHMPGSNAVSRDELMILSALAAVQDEEPLDDDAPRAAADLAELLGGRIDASVVSAFRHVGGLLSEGGRRLSAPGLARPAFVRPGRGPETLH
jgi:hypothetical protein